MSIESPIEEAFEKLKEHFSQVPDPRVRRNLFHPLVNILVIAFAAVVCGAEGITEIAQFGRHKWAFFERFLDLSEGIPSRDVFAAIDTQYFAARFTVWVHACFDIPEGTTINIDIAFAVEASQVRDHNAAANLAILNKMPLNILKTDTTEKVGIKAKRKTAGWNDAYLARLLISILCKD